MPRIRRATIKSWFSSTTVWMKLNTAEKVHGMIMGQNSNIRQYFDKYISVLLVQRKRLPLALYEKEKVITAFFM